MTRVFKCYGADLLSEKSGDINYIVHLAMGNVMESYLFNCPSLVYMVLVAPLKFRVDLKSEFDLLYNSEYLRTVSK